MAYKVLYRKYRPNTFDEVVGQKVIVDTLKKSIMDDNFCHAYMFTGPRGTGKTSTAKILAKAINCLNPKEGEPCNECERCKSFTTSPDIIEIDAASNNGVDEIRELRNNITLVPANSKYKVYIIDEVHMLSPGAFNALLKTLEEPPAHVIFILATTEVYKVPITILSRCQRFDFKKINQEDMINHLELICSKENIKYEKEALMEIYSLSDGCLRDALSILDQTSKITKEITLKDILLEYSMISSKSVDDLLMCIKNNDLNTLISKLNEFEETGINVQKFIKKVILYLEEIGLNIKLNKEKRFDFKVINYLIRELDNCYINARLNENTFAIIKLIFMSLINSSNVEGNTAKIENKTIEEKPVITGETTKETNDNIVDIRINNCFVDASKTDLNEILGLWSKLDSKIPTIDFINYTPVASSKGHVILKTEEESLADLFNIKLNEIEKYLTENGIDKKFIAISKDKWEIVKKDYINNIKNKYKYEFIKEPKQKDENSVIIEKINDIFDKDLVEIS